MKIWKPLCLIVVVIAFSACSAQKTQPKTQDLIDTTTPVSETESVVVELTKEEYKELCRDAYNDDFFKATPEIGESLKIHVMVSEKNSFSSSDPQGIILRHIISEYNLEHKYIACSVMHNAKETDTVPNYFGKHIYLMIKTNGNIDMETFKTGDKAIIYGDVIKNDNGTFILPKYYELEQ